MAWRLLLNVYHAALDLIFPPRCISCKAANSWLCQRCLSNVSFITTDVCKQCGTPASTVLLTTCLQCDNHPLIYIDGIRAASSFEDSPMRAAIHFLKYRNHQAVALILANLLAEAYYRYDLMVDLIVSVPLHQARLKERGYNQSELLARQLGRLLNLPVNSGSLQRIRNTPAQVKLSGIERRNNVEDAFRYDPCEPARRVLLIDDVCTTGSTLDACAKALKAGGVASVWGLTLSRA